MKKQKNKNPSQITELLPNQWALFKSFRLQAMRAEPVAFKTSYKEIRIMTDGQWEEELRRSAAGNDAKLFFIKYNNELAGMLGIRYDTTEKRKHIAYIFEVYLKKKFRGQGLGKNMFLFALDYIKQKKRRIKKIQLSVTESQQSALRLYYTAGFNVIGYAKEEKKIGKKYYDQFLMEKFIR